MVNDIKTLKQMVNDPTDKQMKLLIYGKDNFDDDTSSSFNHDSHDSDIHKETCFFKVDELSNLISPADLLRELGPFVTSTAENLEIAL